MVVTVCTGVLLALLLLIWCIGTVRGHRRSRKRMKRAMRPKSSWSRLTRRRPR